MKSETFMFIAICTACICSSVLLSGYTISQDKPQYYEYERILNITEGGGSWHTFGNEKFFVYQFFLDTGYSEMYIRVPGITNLYTHKPYYNETCWIRYTMKNLMDIQYLSIYNYIENR